MSSDIGWLLVGAIVTIAIGLSLLTQVLSRWLPFLTRWLKRLAIVILLLSFGAILGASITRWIIAAPVLPITIAPPVRA